MIASSVKQPQQPNRRNEMDDKEDSAGFADEPHGTLIYLIVLAACFGAVAVVLGFLP